MSNRFHTKLGGASTAILAMGLAGAAAADVPSVATDIAPVHGLVARVMEGLGTPDLIVRQGATPHDYALRPSEAQALESAGAVFWIGPELEPWLEDSIATLAPEAETVALLDLPQTETRAFREGVSFEAHSHDHGDHGDHDHDAHAGHDHGHDDHAHDDHGHADPAGEHAHDHDGTDPHAWLDPRNAMVWLDAIAERLGGIDPDNAETYARNAEAGKAEIEAAAARIDDMLEPVQDIRFVVFHDAYQYFETRFDVPAAGAIALSDASTPSPARIEEIRDTVAQLEVTCVFAEPQFNSDIVATVLDGTQGRAATIDPLGAEIALGPDFYPALLRGIATTMADCAG